MDKCIVLFKQFSLCFSATLKDACQKAIELTKEIIKDLNEERMLDDCRKKQGPTYRYMIDDLKYTYLDE